ncbi:MULTISPECIES: glycoside hydrolase family 27 protein [unclassified Streptomyces]|uniref:glycoside hydrolase family 27 protein n=1 Tax=unclassified Streptomyces TaxID=2593676 RepID=UPI002E231A61|nr:glycoside hydrolase family 27 protein [Streptomyces sp. NBC_01023]
MRLAKMPLIPVLALILSGAATAAAAPPGQPGSHTATTHPVTRTASTPPMGWSSWSFLRSKPTEQNIEAQGQAMHDSGLEAHGYQYVNIDAGWSDHLDAYGRDAWNPSSFPGGIPAVARHLHSRGLKLGIYLTPGIPKAAVDANLPIQGTRYHLADIADTTQPGNTHDDSWRIDFSKPGAQEYVQGYADLFASWGVDYIKMDFVGPGGGLVPADDRPDIQAWHRALQHTGRPVNLELSNSLSLADADVWKANSNGWRIDGDIECYHCTTVGLTDWAHILKRFTDVPKWAPYGSRGGWNDLDSLEIGNGANDGLTPDERRTTMTLWAISAAPLLLGTDLTAMDPDDLKTLTNDEVIAVDRAGRPARPVSGSGLQQVWSSENADGSYTVALFNLADTAAKTTVEWSDLGTDGRNGKVRDLWAHRNLGTHRASFSATLPAHGSRLLHVSVR